MHLSTIPRRNNIRALNENCPQIRVSERKTANRYLWHTPTNWVVMRWHVAAYSFNDGEQWKKWMKMKKKKLSYEPVENNVRYFSKFYSEFSHFSRLRTKQEALLVSTLYFALQAKGGKRLMRRFFHYSNFEVFALCFFCYFFAENDTFVDFFKRTVISASLFVGPSNSFCRQ